MSNSSHAGMHNLRLENITPILNVKDISVSIEFYVKTMGFVEAEWGKGTPFTSLNRDELGIYLGQGDQGCKGTWIWMGFDGDIHALHSELKSKGVVILEPPTNYSWAMEMKIKDPDGHVLRLGTDPDMRRPYVDKDQYGQRDQLPG
jgi:catechol 2,3-dioxygenase-like lactoylglutathione lyase family enzyme